MNSPTSNFENMTTAEFESRLPDLFANGKGRVSDDPNVKKFLEQNPTCAALVHDLEYIAEIAGDILRPTEQEPSPAVWQNIESRMKNAAVGEEPE